MTLPAPITRQDTYCGHTHPVPPEIASMFRRNPPLVLALMLFLFCFSARCPETRAGAPVPQPDETQSHNTTIVTLAPNLTEIVYLLEQGHRIKGVSSFDTWPEPVRALPKIGGYFNPDIEGLLRLKPDMIFLLQGRSDLKSRLETFGFSVWEFRCDSLEDIRAAIIRIGRILGVDAKAEARVASLDADLAAVRLKTDKPPRVMICVGMTGGLLQNLYVAGGKSFHHDIIDAIGAVNVFAGSSQAYFAVNRESVIAAQPDIILDLIPGDPLDEKSRKERLSAWEGLGSVPAVRHHRIILLNDDYISIPGPRVTRIAHLFSRRIQSVWNPDHDTP
jgi:iron complex transport system substrate-binding protein